MGYNKTIQMCIFDGNPNGRIMCELSNWNGRVYKVSRSDLNEFAKRDDADFTGVYFLFGKNSDNDETIYIGEAEKLCTRLKQHLKDESYWNDCVVVLSKDNVLNKAHVKYLENSFYCIAKEANRAEIVNNNIPTRSSISEFDESMLIEFIDNTKLLVSTLGYKSFEKYEQPSGKKAILFSIVAAREANATGYLVPDGFAVCKGSHIAINTVPSMGKSLVELRNRLIEKGVIGNDLVFSADYVFSSPSLAAAIVMGRKANGRTEWKTSDKKTINMLEQ